ncbi:denticleless protein homolog A isoform X2 [Olea europaea var. sylvestris]|uniref:Denticleless homolog A-like n=1 Tax=Olea europaea subsp. europaea TaxID=158383 RepID=A0A8S0U6I0_OLEEU|nr:denticleless protein homolog A isoform X2 [Olea europaea var. sylvestris]CAA3014152.1 denticleless homolog A-like [Olea europaea subsp. europaea]
MEFFNRQSFFNDIQSRELNGFRVRKRPHYMGNDSQDLAPIGAVAVEHDGDLSPPMALSFCKTNKNAHILALTDEGGYIGLYNTRKKFTDSSHYGENAEKAKVSEWVAHDNAIFDICWIKDDTNLLTASGDQSIKVWDTQEKKCIRALMGHTGSVKSISSHPTNQDLVASGSRDGSFALWDTRCSNTYQKLFLSPISTVYEAHLSCGRRRLRRRKAESMSITSVLYLKDEVSIATAGAVDSVIKFWDTRHLKGPVTQACPQSESTAKEKRLHGISSLSQDLNGVFITASCMDHRIYMYNVLQLERGAIKSFSGGRIESFFVKSVISPDASHVLSGSGDGNAYIWQVHEPQSDPITLKSHDGEVTAVDWCPSEIGKVATCSDDFTVRFWNIQSSCYSNTRSPSSIRKRVMAMPRMERRKLFVDEASSIKSDTKNWTSNVVSNVCMSGSSRMQEVGTPESQEKRISFNPDVKENLDKTPEAKIKSPSSVLNPPSSLKRKTIRDYFLVS